MNLSNFDAVIFDMDGVITTEKMYWRTAALTVAELISGGKDLADSDELYNCIFHGEETIKLIKNLGVNTNYDLAYVVYCTYIALNPAAKEITDEHFQKVFDKIKKCRISAPELYEVCCADAARALGKDKKELARGASPLWDRLIKFFQLWYLGTEKYNSLTGSKETAPRKGLCKADKYPAVSMEDLHDTLKFLKSKGLKLGIGTGRPLFEALSPLKLWNIYDYFEEDMICTLTEVENAEKTLRTAVTLTKPHPFVFLKSLFGRDCSDSKLICGDYPKDAPKRALIVGDAAADLLAAKQGGFPFLGVMTGVDGNAAKKFFEENGADYILPSISEMRD